MKQHLKLVTPDTEKRTVAPGRKPNEAYRKREHLTEAEVEKLIKAAKANRWGDRDATMVLVAYRHGLRASELVDLHWSQTDSATGNLHVRRVKKGSPSTHPIRGDELRALRKLQREQEPVLRVRFRARLALHDGRFRSHDRARWRGRRAQLQRPSAHVTPRLRLQAGQRWRRHQSVASLPRPPQHPAHDALHRTRANAVQGLLR